MDEKPTRAAIYARISDDTEGRAAGVERQVEDCRALSERLGWTLRPDAEPILIDNDLSASTRSKARRPAFAQLMDGVAAGTYDGTYDGTLPGTESGLRRPRRNGLPGAHVQPLRLRALDSRCHMQPEEGLVGHLALVVDEPQREPVGSPHR